MSWHPEPYRTRYVSCSVDERFTTLLAFWLSTSDFTDSFWHHALS